MLRVAHIKAHVMCILALTALGCSGDNPLRPDNSPAMSHSVSLSASRIDGPGGGNGPKKNLVRNPGFEQGMMFWYPTQYSSGWFIDEHNPRSGAMCMTFTFPEGYGYYEAGMATGGYDIAVEGGATYRLSYWVRETGVLDPSLPGTSVVECLICVGSTCYTVVPDPMASETWQLVSGTVTFPADGDARVKIEVRGMAMIDDARVALDDFMFMKK